MFCAVKTNDMLAKLAGSTKSIECRVNLFLWMNKKSFQTINWNSFELPSLSHHRPRNKTKTKDKRDILRNVDLLLDWWPHQAEFLVTLKKDTACSPFFIVRLCSDNKQLKNERFNPHGPTEVLPWSHENGLNSQRQKICPPWLQII